MKRFTSFAAVTVLVPIATFAVVFEGQGEVQKPDEKVLVNPYMPLAVGNTWEYQSGGKKVVVKVAAHETKEGLACARLETDVSGGTISEHITVKEDGIYRVLANGQKLDPPLLLLKLPSGKDAPKGSESWAVSSTIQSFTMKGKLSVDEDKLKIGKEQFETLKVKSSDFSMGGQNVEMETWYAKDKGMVKQRFRLPSAELDVVLELESFTAGK